MTWGEMLACMRDALRPKGTDDIVPLRTHTTLYWPTDEAQALVDEIEAAQRRCQLEGTKLSKLESLALEVVLQSTYLK